jgi:hypothetical protein
VKQVSVVSVVSSMIPSFDSNIRGVLVWNLRF